MPKLTVVIDDEMNLKLNSKPNKAEFIRQAINEKLQRDKKPEAAENESAKEFMSLVSKMTKMLDKNQDTLDDLKKIFLNHDAKFHLSYARNESQFYEIMNIIIRNNIFGVQAVGRDWFIENKQIIQENVDRSMNDLMQRLKTSTEEVINGKK